MENLKTNTASLNPENPCYTSVCGGGGNLLTNKTKRPFRAKAHKFFGALSAFTLSEVLVTLTILGILASIIVPNVVQRYQDRQTVTAVKRAYSILDNAIQQMYVIEGNPYTWDLTGLDIKQKAELFGETLSHYLPVEKYCGKERGCFQYGWDSDGSIWKDDYWARYKRFSGTTDTGAYSLLEASSYGKMKLKNGMDIAIPPTYMDSYGVANIRVDINAEKGPNRIGYDVFFFNINEKGLNNIKRNDVKFVNDNGIIFNPANCKRNVDNISYYDGVSCSTWVMKHGNLDYKYRDVSAEW